MKRLLLLLLLVAAPALCAFGQSPNYGSGFTTSGLTLNGGAVITSGRLRLTDGGTGESRSAFFNTPVNVQSFTSDFTFLLTNAKADGFTFTIQGIGQTALGAGGGSLGYGPSSNGSIQGISNSVAIGFQLYSTVLGNKEVSLTGDWTNGAAPYATPGTDTTSSGVNLHSGDVMSAHVTYDGTTLAWTITDTKTAKVFTKSVALNIPALAGNTAYVGFTGGSGGLGAIQDILTWTYTVSGAPVPPSITTQPTSQTVVAGQSANFSVVASGSTPLSYQWYENGSNIPGATSSSYTTPPTTSNDNGSTFQVIVSNSGGSANSNTVTLTVQTSEPTIDYSSGFTSPNLTLNGGAAINGTALVLTDGGSGEARSAFFNNPVNVQSFTNDFTFQLTSANADGFTFTIQGVGSTALGGGGGSLGYGPTSSKTGTGGIGSSVAVGFQLYSTVLGNKEVSLTGSWTNGASPAAAPGANTTGSGVNLHSGDVMSVHMTYDGTTLTWTITDTVTQKTFTQSIAIDIASLTGSTAYVGFTGGSGGLTAVQKILTWSFTSSVNTQQVATPTFSPSAGTYGSTQSVSISDTTSGSTIFYTTDGTTPTTSSTQYTAPITVSATTTIEAMATASGMTNSAVATATYTITTQVATPTFNPAAGTYSSAQSVSISDTTSGASIYYTTNGTTPSTSSTQYTTPITVSSTETINAIAAASGMTNSAVASATYTIQTGGGGGSSPNYGGGFTSSGLTLNGGATISGSALQLTDGGTSEARSAFFNSTVNVQSFVTDFTFQLISASADGFTFTIQGNNPAALGAGGGSLGYGPSSSSPGIPNSVAVKFDLYSNSGEGNNSTGLYTNGSSPTVPATTISGVSLHSGDVLQAHLAYDGSKLTLQITDTKTGAAFTQTFSINIPGTVGGTSAYVGFTAGTGGLSSTQNILTWRYTAVPVSSFAWPVDTPITYAPAANGGPSDYSTYSSQSPIFGQYHTGIDVCPQSPGCQIGNPVYSTSSGVVELALVVSDPAQTLCDGSSTAGYQVNPSSSNLGNVIIIAHPNGKFSLYGHLDCVWPGVVPGLQVNAGDRIGNMGHSGFGSRDRTFVPHTHFEIKDRAVTGDPAHKGYSGYTPDLPDGYGYHDARIYINPFSSTSISPVAVKVVASSAQTIFTGPDTSFASLASISPGQEFVAFASSGSWYEIYMPNDNAPVAGWAQASSGGQTLVTTDSGATVAQVSGASSSGLGIQPGPSSSTSLESWDETFGNCTPKAKIWNGQRYVSQASQNNFNEFYLPSNFYFSSGGACAEPSAGGPSVGWASTTFFH